MNAIGLCLLGSISVYKKGDIEESMSNTAETGEHLSDISQ